MEATRSPHAYQALKLVSLRLRPRRRRLYRVGSVPDTVNPALALISSRGRSLTLRRASRALSRTKPSR